MTNAGQDHHPCKMCDSVRPNSTKNGQTGKELNNDEHTKSDELPKTEKRAGDNKQLKTYKEPKTGKHPKIDTKLKNNFKSTNSPN